MEFKDILKELRTDRGLSHRSLSEAIGYSYSAISKWELGKQKPTLDALIAMSRYFNVTIDFLAGLEN